MASHHQPGKVVPLRGQPRDYDVRVPPVDVIQCLRDRQSIRPPLLDRIADALSSPRFVLFYLGFYSGCMATVALAALWSVL